MGRRIWIRNVLLVYSLTLVILALNVSNNFILLYSHSEISGDLCLENKDISKFKNEVERNVSSKIPRQIHQMFFNVTDKIIPTNLERSRQTWLPHVHNSSYNYTLWNADMVFDLIKNKYLELLPLYTSYSHWVKRSDVGRYVILYEYGGVYVDLDIAAKGNIESLLGSLDADTDVLLYYTKPVGVSNDFMISKQRHPFFRHVLCGLEAGNRWFILPYLTTLMTTGPGYLYGKYNTYHKHRDISIVDASILKPYLSHKVGGAWHGFDGKLIWWMYLKRVVLIKCAIIALLLIVILYIKRNFKIQNTGWYALLSENHKYFYTKSVTICSRTLKLRR